ncbi:MAG: chromosomal replication initiator protein DnaA, partial [Candidatus Portnoybacteria bacterium CG10_big_fil_rev_8_21_14_0_10_44_7]
KNKSFLVKYVSSDKFTNEFVNSLHAGKIENFKNKYLQADMLIIDDIQFLAGKERTQEQFFHVFNALYQNNKQIILSSDRPPKAIATLEERLRSRFEGGMIADISAPDLETRLAILKTKAAQKELTLDEEILNYVASHIQTNIRELEGALNRILAFYTIHNNLPSLDQTKKILGSIITTPKKITNHKNILKAVSEFYDISPGDLLAKCRKKEIAWPRQIAMYLMRTELNSSYPFIGERFGGRDHTTVIYAYKKVRVEINNSETIQRELNLIKERLYNEDF